MKCVKIFCDSRCVFGAQKKAVIPPAPASHAPTGPRSNFAEFRRQMKAKQKAAAAKADNSAVTGSPKRASSPSLHSPGQLPDRAMIQAVSSNYVAAKATYIRLLHGKIGILVGFFGPSSVHRGRTHIVLG